MTIHVGVVCLTLAIWTLCPINAFARTLYVLAAHGSDLNHGLLEDSALQTIQRAAELVVPGDEVIIGPGIYFERVKLQRKGLRGKPITFRADAIAKNRVILSGAHRITRSGHTAWTLDDGRYHLYSTPYAGDVPARV